MSSLNLSDLGKDLIDIYNYNTHSNKVAKHTYTNTKLKYKNIRTKPKEDIYIYTYE